jgi:hypothetical protein
MTSLYRVGERWLFQERETVLTRATPMEMREPFPYPLHTGMTEAQDGSNAR